MKIFIPTARRALTITTHAMLEAENLDYALVVDTARDADMYHRYTGVSFQRIVVAEGCVGLAGPHRQWIHDNLVDNGEWFLQLDDDIRFITAPPVAVYSYYKDFIPTRTYPSLMACLRPYKTNEIPFSRFLSMVSADIDLAESRGAWFLGYSQQDNPYYREHHYADVGYVMTTLCATRKDHLRYDPSLVSIDDFDFTAAHLYEHGRVLINRWVYPVAGHYTVGGLGTYSERLPARLRDCERIMSKWPGLYRFKKARAGSPPNDLTLTMYTVAKIAKWKSGLVRWT